MRRLPARRRRCCGMGGLVKLPRRQLVAHSHNGRRNRAGSDDRPTHGPRAHQGAGQGDSTDIAVLGLQLRGPAGGVRVAIVTHRPAVSTMWKGPHPVARHVTSAGYHNEGGSL